MNSIIHLPFNSRNTHRGADLWHCRCPAEKFQCPTLGTALAGAHLAPAGLAVFGWPRRWWDKNGGSYEKQLRNLVWENLQDLQPGYDWMFFGCFLINESRWRYLNTTSVVQEFFVRDVHETRQRCGAPHGNSWWGHSKKGASTTKLNGEHNCESSGALTGIHTHVITCIYIHIFTIIYTCICVKFSSISIYSKYSLRSLKEVRKCTYKFHEHFHHDKQQIRSWRYELWFSKLHHWPQELIYKTKGISKAILKYWHSQLVSSLLWAFNSVFFWYFIIRWLGGS